MEYYFLKSIILEQKTFSTDNRFNALELTSKPVEFTVIVSIVRMQ